MKEVQKKQIVISGVNLFSGGPLTILQECLFFLENCKEITNSYCILALVYRKDLFPPFKNIEIFAYEKPRSNWLYKLYYEYFFFKKIFKHKQVYLWLSLHDITPSVIAERRAVYCHNPAPFYKTSTLERQFDKGFTLFSLFYKYLYAININKNNYVIVQQNWMRKRFIELFGLLESRVIVAHPNIELKQTEFQGSSANETVCFFYPALPRVFKNFEVIWKAISYVKQQITIPFSVVLTISGIENKYAKYVKKNCADLPEIQFLGLQNKDQMNKLYLSSSCLLFPSKLETWGLPISEAKMYKKPMLVADLPYAKETVGDYKEVSFFEPNNYQMLADLMIQFIKDEIVFLGNKLIKPSEPFSEDWNQTFRLLLQ